MLAYIHVGLARIDLARGEPQAARTKLERALALRSEGGAARDELGEVRFELALLDAAAGETAKAEQLAATAKADYLASGKARPNELARIDAWLAGRR
jgi:ATP/maltotriose-dependent transcriptional regulator MalT